MKLACAAVIALGLSTSMAHAASPSCKATATKMLDYLDQGDYAGATADFNDRMNANLSADKLGKLWQNVSQQPSGTHGVREPAQLSEEQGYAVVMTTLHYGQNAIDTRVVCDADGKVGGFFIRPHH